MLDSLWSLAPHTEARAFEVLHAYASKIRADGVSDAMPEITGATASEAQRAGYPVAVSNGMAIVSIMGPMVRRAGPIAQAFGIAGTDSARLAIEIANADPAVERIVLRIDSPGGSVAGLDQLGAAVAATNKPTTAVVDGMAASAAYYVASQADRIVAGPTDLVGSIGTRIGLYDMSKAFEMLGIEAVPIDTGAFKSAGMEGTPITPAQRADFQRIVDFYFADFVAAVSRGREMPTDQVKALADGRVFPAPEALTSGLIDGIQSLRDALSSERSKILRSTDSARARLRL